ncbi:MAG: hypothetical protein ACTSYT_02120 [Candidatus Asgardarchaeia archaeon]
MGKQRDIDFEDLIWKVARVFLNGLNRILKQLEEVERRVDDIQRKVESLENRVGILESVVNPQRNLMPNLQTQQMPKQTQPPIYTNVPPKQYPPKPSGQQLGVREYGQIAPSSIALSQQPQKQNMMIPQQSRPIPPSQNTTIQQQTQPQRISPQNLQKALIDELKQVFGKK